jgi:hypothetical protein
VIHGPTAAHHWEPASARRQLGRTAAAARVRRRFASHQLRHAHAIEMATKEGIVRWRGGRRLASANAQPASPLSAPRSAPLLALSGSQVEQPDLTGGCAEEDNSGAIASTLRRAPIDLTREGAGVVRPSGPKEG